MDKQGNYPSIIPFLLGVLAAKHIHSQTAMCIETSTNDLSVLSSHFLSAHLTIPLLH